MGGIDHHILYLIISLQYLTHTGNYYSIMIKRSWSWLVPRSQSQFSLLTASHLLGFPSSSSPSSFLFTLLYCTFVCFVCQKINVWKICGALLSYDLEQRCSRSAGSNPLYISCCKYISVRNSCRHVGLSSSSMLDSLLQELGNILCISICRDG